MTDYKKLFDRFVEGVYSIYGHDLLKIILYGSFARGEQTINSDIDIAVIIRQDDPEKHNKMTVLAVDLDLEYDVVLSVLAIENHDFREWENVLPFYKNVKKDGIMLWNAA